MMHESGAAAAQNGATGPQPGIARELARFRAAHYRDVHYDLHLELTTGAPTLKGLARIRVTVDETQDDLILDWRVVARPDRLPSRVWDIRANGATVNDARFVNDHLLIAGSYLQRGENLLEMAFESPIATSGSAVTRYHDHTDGAEYLYTLLVPCDASTTFPCFDQPDLKARFRLTVHSPAAWKIISNGAVEGTPEAVEGAIGTGAGGWQQTRFHETEPISTYLFAFAAGPFTEFQDEQSALPLRLFVRQSKEAQARQELAEVFRLHRTGLKFLASYFDAEFPFPKYDLVLVPEFAYGGMEHAGATFLREDVVLFPADPAATDILRRAATMLHEAAHQWFGDLVTMRWFDDLWLKEGFATFMAYKAMEAVMPPVMPQINIWKVFYQRTKPGAYATDVTPGTTPIFQEIANLAAAKSAYGNIVYLKAPSLLRQAEFLLGADHFQQAVRRFVKAHAYGNAEWADLVHAFADASGRPMDQWANSWVRRRGMPDVRVAWSADRHGRIKRFALRETDVLGQGGSWPLRLKVLLADDAGTVETLTVDVPGAGETHVPAAIGKRRPAYVFANAEDYGYGRFLLDQRSERAVRACLGTIHDDFLRALLWGSLWDAVREAQLAPGSYLELGQVCLPGEQDAVVVQSILSHMARAFNSYLSDSQRHQIAPSLEHLMAERMISAETVSLRITYFRAFRSIASSPAARGALKQLLTGELTIPGMTLRSRDRFDIVTALFTRGDADAVRLLDTQRLADTSDDGRRYAYAATAAQANPTNKQTYFAAYLDDRQLPESWIEASLDSFNTVAQAPLTLPYLAPALKALPALKRTRKIFFVNNWLATFISGQNSAPALATVREFLRREPDLDPDLRRKVLEVADDLARCVRIRRKYAR